MRPTPPRPPPSCGRARPPDLVPSGKRLSSRDRKRADRRKRKERSAARPAVPATADGGAEAQPAGPSPGAGGDEVMDLAAEAEARGVSKSELRDERAREELEPLDRESGRSSSRSGR